MSKRLQVVLTDEAWQAVEALCSDANHNFELGHITYSDTIKNLKITWDFDHLDRFITNPKAYAKGTKMSFPGIKKPEERAALLRWLRDQADSPAPLPQ